MNSEVKRYADSHDLKSLKYIFVDSLDVDPTFTGYEEEYNYCRSCGVLESHIELTPFVYQKSRWNLDYWATLKKDLLKNFSEKRMLHMREVAKTIFAEKIDRINEERRVRIEEAKCKLTAENRAVDKVSVQEQQVTNNNNKIMKAKERQAREIEEAKRKLAAENRAVDKARIQKEQEQQELINKSIGTYPKKSMGIVVAAIAVALVILIWLLH